MGTKSADSRIDELRLGSSGVFDHQIVTLDDSAYLKMREFFKSEPILKSEAISWRDDKDVKGFIFFDDQSYFEVWNRCKFGHYGYQDACRVQTEDTVDKIAMLYGVEPGKFPSFVVAGRTGWTGSPNGGMFFIWQPSRQINAQKNGIRWVLNAVEPAANGDIRNDIIADYQLAGLNVELRHNNTVLAASDSGGVTRIFIATPGLKGNGLIALGFSRAGSDAKTMTFQNAPVAPPMFLELKPGKGAIVLRGDLYETALKFVGEN
jgi:hypothetical protein